MRPGRYQMRWLVLLVAAALALTVVNLWLVGRHSVSLRVVAASHAD